MGADGSEGAAPSTIVPVPPPGRLLRGLLAAGLGTLVVLAGYAVYVSEPARSEPTLVVYTYASLLGGNCGANTSAEFGPFERAHHVHLEFECPAGTLASTLIAQRGAPSADVVLGLDEITGPQADAAGVLVPYVPSGLANLAPGLVDEIAPDHAVTPYEWGYLGIDYCPAFDTASGGALQQLNLPEIAANGSWASNLIVEDPTVDIVGEEFLLWEIAYYTEVAHADWRPWWSAVAPRMTSADSWDTAFGLFSCRAGTPQMVVSFLNDPAYAAYYGAAGSLNSSVSWANGTAYGWKTIFGAGIVRGSAHLALDEALVDWMLDPTVQSAIPTTEWEYPANTTQSVPSEYSRAMNSSGVRTLNDAFGPATVAAELPDWLSAWQATVNAAA